MELNDRVIVIEWTNGVWLILSIYAFKKALDSYFKSFLLFRNRLFENNLIDDFHKLFITIYPVLNYCLYDYIELR